MYGRHGDGGGGELVIINQAVAQVLFLWLDFCSSSYATSSSSRPYLNHSSPSFVLRGGGGGGRDLGKFRHQHIHM